MDYNDAYVISKNAVDDAVFSDSALLDAYNEMIGSGDSRFVDRVQEPVFDLENEVRGELLAAFGEDGGRGGDPESLAAEVAGRGAGAVMEHLARCAREAGVRGHR